ncbi:iron-containing redox enzyme family protein [Frankia sp. AgB32]|uniref:iron-containing redox enzyme family protein n=1 Tax=Frankia sp. AgB32 TaxID=631119 RepID=UPI00200E72BF|nr:iron-containing redox enzyme family protein [Frankia sp. AgB32]MCK9897149.1 iron-containing redox enzyme family protein [Frankia sp. AgB32]
MTTAQPSPAQPSPRPAAVAYGAVLSPAELAPRALPRPRGTLSAFLADTLRGPVRDLADPPGPDDDALFGEDGALALHCLYELHYRGFADVADGWEWEPSLLRLRRDLEEDFDARLRQEITAAGLAAPAPAPAGRAGAAWIGDALRDLVDAPGGPSVSRHLADRGSLEEFREFVIHRSLLQLKEADPHSWAIPRLRGAAKAALIEIQTDEYGDGVQRDMHQTLFGLTMRALDLDPAYGAYVDRVPAATLATGNLPTYFGLHRAHRGALVGHLAVFEMTSVTPMSAYSAALRRHGLPPAARLFFDTHVVADVHHRSVAADSLAGGLVREEPELAADLLFGARAAMVLEDHAARPILAAWEAGVSSLR